ncbi:MAG: hypothetical protein HUK40_16270 [Desulfobacter sp.]|nr:hypothetical protein [Desulfobacter sp.]WDP87079.1 MAG: hypothetical protein HUN05_19710 [Desulfobacter sp.]
MKGPYKLFCEYVHCCGKKTLELGVAQTESIAKQWIKEQTQNRKRPKLPLDDLIRTCPVNHCPAKRQFPRYDYCPMDR